MEMFSEPLAVTYLHMGIRDHMSSSVLQHKAGGWTPHI